jgi:hypothetical protein
MTNRGQHHRAGDALNLKPWCSESFPTRASCKKKYSFKLAHADLIDFHSPALFARIPVTSFTRKYISPILFDHYFKKPSKVQFLDFLKRNVTLLSIDRIFSF